MTPPTAPRKGRRSAVRHLHPVDPPTYPAPAPTVDPDRVAAAHTAYRSLARPAQDAVARLWRDAGLPRIPDATAGQLELFEAFVALMAPYRDVPTPGGAV